ncbi:MAG: COX15/CtaA family protein, partial [Bacteroidota bacterium]|nr:COX15/CtaA family protein [Bacteroidota bacterium]
MKSIEPNTQAPKHRTPNLWLHYFAFFTSCLTFPLIFVGGLVKSHEAGLSVPDWPTSYGYNMFTFPFHWMVGNIFYEHGHRLYASLVGFFILVLAIWIWRKEPRAWVRKLGWFTLAAVAVQGILGGITVKTLLLWYVSTAHAALAQTTFCLTVALSMVTSKWWRDDVQKTMSEATDRLQTLTLVTVVAIFIQLLFGAVMRHLNAGLAIPTWPLSNGSLIPEFTSVGVTLNFIHRSWAFVVAILIFTTAYQAIKASKAHPAFRKPAIAGVVFVIIQITLGAITILSEKDPNWTSFHV